MGKRIEGLDRGLAISAWWLLSAPVDFRCGVDRLLVHVREALGRDPLDGSAYVFCNRRTSRMKVLVVDAQGVWLATRRLHQGRFGGRRQRRRCGRSRTVSSGGCVRESIGGVCHVKQVH